VAKELACMAVDGHFSSSLCKVVCKVW